FVEPLRYQTILVDVLSTLSCMGLKKVDETMIVFASRDRATRQVMWKFRKQYSQLVEFDRLIRPLVTVVSFPPLPEKPFFVLNTPLKVDVRRGQLKEYFTALFQIPLAPQAVHHICRFVSLDTVSPLDEFGTGVRKSGFLIRRTKSLSRETWKVKWCQVDGLVFEIYDSPGGLISESISLVNAQIGRQSSGPGSDDKTMKHAFMIMEPKKSAGSYSRFAFCAETDEERDDWIGAILEFIEGNNNDDSHGNGGRTSYGNSSSTFRNNGSKADYKPVSFGTPSPYSASNHSATSLGPEDDEPLEDLKKSKIRSFFPFRSTPGKSANASEDLSAYSKSGLLATTMPSEEPISTQQVLDDLRAAQGSAARAHGVFGNDLGAALALSSGELFGKSIPSIVFRCLDYLLKTGAIYEEGLFRLNGSAAQIKHFKEQFDTSYDVNFVSMPAIPDINTVAGLLKLYLRELPVLILSDMAGAYRDESKETDYKKVAYGFRELTQRLPTAHRDLLYVLFRFLKQVVDNCNSNKMNLKNVCIVFSPTLNILPNVILPFLVDFECVFGAGEPTPTEKRETLGLAFP
ncbi:hypothetical protein BABINDRAFT_20078, partial [Babjeviella inositovora NRRL Y-12698]